MLPSAAITLVGVLGIGPAAPKGALAGQFDLVGDLVWASPTVLWAVGWLGAGQFPVRCRVVQNTAAC